VSKPDLLSLDDHVLRLDELDTAEADFKDRIHERLMALSECEPSTDCYVYTGCWEESGQAKMRVGGRVYHVSRVAAWVYFEDFQIWSNARTLRTCKTPACCNPEHIYVVRNQREAMAATKAAGRLVTTSNRLTRLAAARMRHLFSQGWPMPDLAREFKVRVAAVRAVIYGRTWKDKQGQG
jgi:hypothetical protein